MLTPSATAPLVKVAIYRSTSIGDVVLATACIDLLRQISAPVQVTWIGRKPALQLIAAAFPEIRTIEADPDVVNYQEKAVKELRDVHFIVDLQTNLRSQLLCRALRREYKIPSFSAKKKSLDRGAMTMAARLRGRRRALPETLRQCPEYQFDMMLDTLREALKAHLPIEVLDGLERLPARPLLPTVHDAGQKPWQKELKFGNWLAIAPGAAHESKKAPLEMLRHVTELLAIELKRDQRLPEAGIGLLFVGNDLDRDVALGILDKLDWNGPTLNLAGKLSLWETALALKDSCGLLCNDSGLLHIAEAVGTPVAALFGPTVEAFGFAPWRAESRVFSAPLGCRPCSKHGQADCRFDDKLCFGLIQIPPIVDFLKAMIVHKLLRPDA